MRGTLEEIAARPLGARARALAAGALLVAVALGAAAATPALGASAVKEEFAPFADCPVETAALCIVARTTGGEFVIDHKTVPIEGTITLQGGLASNTFTSLPLLGAVGGETLSRTPLTVPGGLAGIAGLGGEVTATAELAGAPGSVIVNKADLLSQSGTAVTLPLKVKLSNEVLGEECYIGSDEEPIVLHLTTGTTSPPLPFSPITGARGKIEGKAKGKIVAISGTSLVDNDFSVPGATGCGGSLSAVVDAAVDLDVGIPSPAGLNTAVMDGSLEETTAAYAAKYKPKPKKTKKQG